MDKNTKDQVLSGVKNTFKVVGKSIKNVYDKSLAQIAFASHASVFEVVETSNHQKESKVFHGVLDEANNCVYIKANRKKTYKKYLLKGSIIKFEDSNDKYEVEKINYSDTHDYMLSINDQQIAIMCYKIQINKI